MSLLWEIVLIVCGILGLGIAIVVAVVVREAIDIWEREEKPRKPW